jgi:hypothetical protein
MKLNPAEYAILVFGGIRNMSRIIGRSPAAICRWKDPRSKKGCGGRVPTAAQHIILQLAKQFKLPITPADLIYGRTVKRK